MGVYNFVVCPLQCNMIFFCNLWIDFFHWRNYFFLFFSVAFNSHNKSLLIVMMSNNFAELKGTVFKKFDKNNLYQLTCSDVRERLHLLILLVIVSVRNLRELNWDVVYFGQLLPELALVGFSEIIVDWVKHCFIAKFNEIPADVYSG